MANAGISGQQIDEEYCPPKKLAKLGKTIINSRSHWVVPVLPDEELASLLDASIDLCKKGIDGQNEACQRFLREGLTTSFTKILTDDAVNSWKPHIHNCIYTNCEKLVELCVHKLDDDWFPLLDLPAMVFNPNNKFHSFNAAKESKSVPPGSNVPDEELYARPPPNSKDPRGWLVDLINRFGTLGGFDLLLSRFKSERKLTIPLIHALLRPFELCNELLTVHTIVKYLMPIVEMVPVILDNLTDREWDQEPEHESINAIISNIFNAMKSLTSRVPGREENIKNLESQRLKGLLRLLFIIFKNKRELLGTFIFDLDLEELDHFFHCFQTSWTIGDTEEREKLVKLMQRVAEEDKNGVIVHKVLTLFWDLAHSKEISTSTMEQALNAHVKIIDSSCSQGSNAQKKLWLDKCIQELKTGDWTLPALKQIREICDLYDEDIPDNQPIPDGCSRVEAIDSLLREHDLGTLLPNNLSNYMDKMRQLVKENPEINAETFLPDGRYNHALQVQERLDSLRFILRTGHWWLDKTEAKKIWQCLAEHGVFLSDREICFEWFSKIFDIDVDDLDEEDINDVFEGCILQVDPSLLTPIGFTCFKVFFKEANKAEGKLEEKNGVIHAEDLELIGKDYLWRIVTSCPEEIANCGIELLKEVHRNVGSQLQMFFSTFHRTFVEECTNRLQVYCDTLSILTEVYRDEDKEKDDQRRKKIAMETVKMSRVMKVLKEYNIMQECKTMFPQIGKNVDTLGKNVDTFSKCKL